MRDTITYTKILNTDIPLKTMLNVLPTKGNLVYEYNPFRNYRLSTNSYLYKNKQYSLQELNEQGIYPLYKYTSDNGLNFYTVEELKEKFNIEPEDLCLDTRGIEYHSKWKGTDETYVKKLFWNTDEQIDLLLEKGQLTDFITDELNFSLDHPVHIVPQYSYDGSVNLIINDGLNIPRLINSRFSATGKNTYEIVDRKGNNDTNIYDQGEQFNIDTSLYKIVNNIPKLTYLGTSSGGNMKVGNYHFYFKLSDTDGNETDFISESGLVSVFIGYNNFGGVYTGNKNENSTKQIEFRLENLDSAYEYIHIYYSRYTAEDGGNYVSEYKKILKKYPRNASKLIITGFEETEDISVTDLNLHYNLIDAAKTTAVCQNMLFMGNIQKQNIPYEELQDLSLRILPTLGTEEYDPEINHYYYCGDPKNSYINSKFIYDKTGYWKEEFYRFGIVYILPNNQLTPVFNVRGAIDIGALGKQFSEFDVYDNDERHYIKYNENTFLLTEVQNNTTGNQKNIIPYSKENTKGVCRFIAPHPETDNTGQTDIYYINFKIPLDVKKELKKYVKGFFFVRQTRIPMILAQGITIGIDKESRTPTIPTSGGILTTLASQLSYTHVTTDNINGLNYISEGFMRRYKFRFKRKSSSLWSKIGKIAGIAALVVGTVVLGVITGGGAFAATAAIYGTMATVGATAIVTAGAAAAAGIVAAGVTATIAVAQDVGQSIRRNGAVIKLDGRKTKAPSGYKIVETDESRILTHDFNDRIIIKDPTKNLVQGIICPDYTINQAYYNQIFTGNEHLIRSDSRQSAVAEGYSGESYFTNENRHFYIADYRNITYQTQTHAKIIGVADNLTSVGIDDYVFRARAGEAEEGYKCLQVGIKCEGDSQKINSDVIRGSFGPYLAFTNNVIGPAKIVNIYIPGYSDSELLTYMDIRMQDNSSYFAITDRISISEKSTNTGLSNDQSYTHDIWPAFRGDCYICQFTQRVNRNFNDPSAPYNDDFVKTNTWKNNYNPDDPGNYSKINTGDINAVQLGMWVTFQLRSSNNLNIRSLDGSNVDETVMTGHPRSYFPNIPMSVEGIYKKPESQIYNKGFTKSVSDKWNLQVLDAPHIKNWFGTRIMYSDVHINDGFKNGFRIFQGQNYRDYTREYGEIVKLISLDSNLLCVFEHGIALIPVNERAVAGQGSGGTVYINTSNVLPENPRIISDMYGSQWAESILKVPGKDGKNTQYVYGVDTIAKKIWRTDGVRLECISDFRVQEFLNNNITLGERELTPKIGIRNVKTHYNAFKQDVMFTFYDNTYGFEEKVWNLCWNEILQQFITFYSWVPSYMENINNIPFSFNRNTSKWLAKLGTSHQSSSFADGITLTNVVIKDNLNVNASAVDNIKIPITYITKSGEQKTIQGTVENTEKFIAGLSLSNRVLPSNQLYYYINFELLRDSYKNYQLFDIKPITVTYEGVKYDEKGNIILPEDAMFAGSSMPLYGLYFKEDKYEEIKDKSSNPILTLKESYDPKRLHSELYYRNKENRAYSDYDGNKIGTSEGIQYEFPIFKDITGKRLTLPKEEQINSNKLVTLLNIKASILIDDANNKNTLSDTYYNMKSSYANGSKLIDVGYYESTVAITPEWNLQFLSTDFWKHGQAGIIDITDDIKPTYWYGEQHSFEFECIVVNDPSVYKIFQNLELVSNKAKPESFHYEIIGDSYDFAKDKINMYFRQEAKKALWQYNGSDISYNRDFLKIQPKQQYKSADFPYKYYYRQDTINEIEDCYDSITLQNNSRYNYKHLSGAEIVYYQNRQEYRIWQHSPAVDMNDLDSEKSRSIISANCQYLENMWRITINPIIICYKNEKKWASPNRPPLTLENSPIPNDALEAITENNDDIIIPDVLWDHGYTYQDMDPTNWLDDIAIYGTSFGKAQNRRELDVKDKFMKVRIRYSGEELAIIDFLNTIYRISYA